MIYGKVREGQLRSCTMSIEIALSSHLWKNFHMESMRNNHNSTITRIERVENGMLHDAYKVQKTNIAMEITKTTDPAHVSSGMEDKLVKWLFHGTRQENMDKIVNSGAAGFLPMLAGSAVGAIWGDGTYFARDARYSNDYTEPQIQRKMLLNRVIVG